MQFRAILKQGPIYKKWKLLNQHGGTIHGTNFTVMGTKRDAVFVAVDIYDLDALKADPDIVIEMTGVVSPVALGRPAVEPQPVGDQSLTAEARVGVFTIAAETDQEEPADEASGPVKRGRGRPRKDSQ